MHNIFIAHADADHPWVEGYLLPALGLPPDRVLTPRRFEPGIPVVAAFENAVTSSRYTILILTPAFLADEWTQFSDQLTSYARVVDGQQRMIPLYLKPCTLPLHLESCVRLDCTSESNWAAEVNRLRLVLSQPVPVAKQIPCPYPGLMPFSTADSGRFFGREKEVDDLRHKLRYQNLLLVIGPSGSGKSSLVFAGLASELRRQDPDHWQIRSMRPSAFPCNMLNITLGDLINLQASPPTYQQASQSTLLLIVDQFEEIFIQAPKTEQDTFIAALKSLCFVNGCKIVLTMRADFFPDLMNSALWPVHPSQRSEIAPLRGDALRRAIEQPATDVGVYLEPGLVERLLADAADEPGALPLLQETLVLLWEQRTHHFLPLSAYNRVGGLGVAIATAADAALSLLTQGQQSLARRIFLRLVQFGEGRPDTRRQQPESELHSAGDNAATLKTVLDHLASNRLLTLTTDELSHTQLVDLSHEKLITDWPQLQAWVRERKSGEQIRRRLEEHTAEWVRLGRGEGGLLDRAVLQEALEYVSSPTGKEVGASNDLLALIDLSGRSINPGWNRGGLWSLVAIGFTLLALVGLVFLYLPQNLSPTPWSLMLCASLLVLVGLAAITYWLLRRADRFVLQRWTQTIPKRRLAKTSIISAVAIMACLWAVLGTRQAIVAQQCAMAGFDRQMEQLAVLNENVKSPYATLFAAQFQRISWNRLQAEVTAPETAQYCRGYIDYSVTLSEEGHGMPEALYIAKIEANGKRQVVLRPAKQGCRAMLVMPYEILNRLGFTIGTLGDDLTDPTKLSCTALVTYEEGHQHQQRTEWTLAEESYREAIAEKPQYIEAHMNLGVVLTKLGKAIEAVEQLRQAVTLSTDPSVDMLMELGYACYSAGDLACAKSALQEAQAKYETKRPSREQKYVILYLYLGVVYRESSLYEHAQAMFDKFEDLLSLDEANVRSNQIALAKDRGILAFKMGDLAAAEQYLESADQLQQFSLIERIVQIIAAQFSEEITSEMTVDYQGWDEEIVYYLAQIAVKIGQSNTACAYFERYSRIAPSHLYRESVRRATVARQQWILNCDK